MKLRFRGRVSLGGGGPILHFEDFTLDTANFRLLRGGQPVPLEPLVFDLLVLLCERAGRVISRDEIIERVWDGRFVSDSTVSTAIKALRKALGDTGEAQRLIRTVRGRGFEFVAIVARDDPEPHPTPIDTATDDDMQQDITFVTAPDDTQIAVASIGDGPVILRTAHWLSNISLDFASPVFRHWFVALSKAHRFVRYDLRGSGLSDREVEDMSFDAFLSDLEAVAATIDEPITLFGMSQGGPLAIAFAVRHPEKVKRIVLVGSYGQGMLARAKTDRDRMEVETLVNLIHLGWGRKNPAFNQVFTNLFIPGGTEEQHAWWHELERNTATPETAARTLMTNNEIDIFDMATQIRHPTIVFHSRHDARVPFDQGRRLAALIPGAQFVPVESANHVILEHEPAWPVFQRELDAFLKATA